MKSAHCHKDGGTGTESTLGSALSRKRIQNGHGQYRHDSRAGPVEYIISRGVKGNEVERHGK